MSIVRTAAPIAAALALVAGAPLAAQTSTERKISTDTSMNDGVATTTTKVEHTTKRKTHRPKKILGVKVGHKTVTHKTVREHSVSSNGDSSTKVETK